MPDSFTEMLPNAVRSGFFVTILTVSNSAD